MKPSRTPLIRDVLVISVAGVALGLVANAISPRGLSLTRDYFGAITPLKANQDSPAPQSRTVPPAAAEASTGKTARRTGRGLPLVSHDEVAVLFQDPGRAEQRIVFIDARNETEYAGGHIPGALRFDHYRPDATLDQVLAAALVAERLVVYCTGGECEDSDLAAADLVALGIPRSRVVVYSGGINEWKRRGMPVVRGNQPTASVP